MIVTIVFSVGFSSHITKIDDDKLKLFTESVCSLANTPVSKSILKRLASLSATTSQLEYMSDSTRLFTIMFINVGWI